MIIRKCDHSQYIERHQGKSLGKKKNVSLGVEGRGSSTTIRLEKQFRGALKDHLILSPSFNFTVLPQASANFKEGDRPVTCLIKQVFH